jgi:stage III sporulation protein AG
VVVRESMPKVYGVLVVAQGADDPLVREALFDAVQGLLPVRSAQDRDLHWRGGLI